MKTEAHTKTFTRRFVALFLIATPTKWKEATCPSINEMDKQNVVYLHSEYYSVIKKNEVPIHADT